MKRTLIAAVVAAFSFGAAGAADLGGALLKVGSDTTYPPMEMVDPNSGQIMIVKNAPRTPITQNTKNVSWTDDWHQVKVVRDATKGSIEVYFDDMTTPQLSANDKTFGKGRIGIGSFDDMDDFDDVRLYGK